jgi:hypothetical protein
VIKCIDAVALDIGSSEGKPAIDRANLKESPNKLENLNQK